MFPASHLLHEVQMKLTELQQHHWVTGERIAVIETPAKSRFKIDYDADREIFHVHHALPEGMSFPFDFGFIPRTRGMNGDPLEVLILMDEPGYPGLVVRIGVMGVLEAEQTGNDSTFRNDRIIARALDSSYLSQLSTLGALSPQLLDHLETFFISYNRLRGKIFKPLGRSGPEVAEEIIRQSSLDGNKVDRSRV